MRVFFFPALLLRNPFLFTSFLLTLLPSSHSHEVISSTYHIYPPFDLTCASISCLALTRFPSLLHLTEPFLSLYLHSFYRSKPSWPTPSSVFAHLFATPLSSQGKRPLPSISSRFARFLHPSSLQRTSFISHSCISSQSSITNTPNPFPNLPPRRPRRPSSRSIYATLGQKAHQCNHRPRNLTQLPSRWLSLELSPTMSPT